MATIKTLKYSSNNVVTDNGTIFYPVTTANAVYFSQTKTLYELLNNSYSEENLSDTDNGIYAWLRSLTDKFDEYILSSEFDSYKSTINESNQLVTNLSQQYSNLLQQVENMLTTFRNTINQSIIQRTTFNYDNEPTKGSTNLLTSGAIYASLQKIGKSNSSSQSDNVYPKVYNMDTYNANDGEIVQYVGETTETYENGCLYKYIAEITGDTTNRILCENDYDSLSLTGHWEKIDSSTIPDGDLSNYYTKIEIDNIIRNLPNDNTEYTAGDNISIDINNVISAVDTKYTAGRNVVIDENNVINVNIPGTDFSSYYNKNEIDTLLTNIRESINTYTAGDGSVTIDEFNRIFVNFPASDIDLTNYYTKQEIDTMFNPDLDNYYTKSEVEELISDNPQITTESSNVHITKSIVTTSTVKNTSFSTVTTTTTTTSNEQTTTETETEEIPAEESEGLPDGEETLETKKDITYTINVDEPNNGKLTITQGSTTLGEFTANQSGNTTININDPDYPITDVIVNGTSVVTNKVANITLPSNHVINSGGITHIQYVASESAYNNMTKDANTLYFIPVETNNNSNS